MALTYSPPIETNLVLPDFSLPQVNSDKEFSFKKGSRRYFNNPLMVAFICNHCPYVRAIEDRLIRLAHEFIPQGVEILGVCANDPTDHPEDAPRALALRASEKSYPFPYLIDSNQSLARDLGAVCTPDFFVFAGPTWGLVYRGRFDDSWRDETQVSSRDLANALRQILGGQPVASPQYPAMGCSIKWTKQANGNVQ